ncbi:MAG: hypothetical protein IKP49_00790 [Treponema sp.]|nr:hypothetical protein [Treponema sp.]MBR6914133.1 hypothetical protein [Treponema sp.]
MSENQSMADGIGEAWFSKEGPDSDIILSCRARLARNLANFPFPLRFRDDDADHVRSIVFDAFSRCSSPDNYQAIITSNLDLIGKKILCERGVMETSTPVSTGTGIVVSTDGVISCIVNGIDHVRLSAFKSGSACLDTFKAVKKVDDELQDFLQFAANVENGYLTSDIADCGSGMKFSCRVHFPAITTTEQLRGFIAKFAGKGIEFRDSFGLGGEKNSALGYFYQISTKVAGNGSEIEQLASVIGVAKGLADVERKISKELFELRGTEIRDKIYKAYASLKFSLLISEKDAIEVISLIKWGKNLGIVGGITDSELCALLYRIRSGHLQFLMKSRKFSFPKDVEKNTLLKENSLRSLVLQEAFSSLSF